MTDRDRWQAIGWGVVAAIPFVVYVILVSVVQR